MRSSDLAWFGLRSAPFSKEISDDDLWMPTSKAELIDELGRASIAIPKSPGLLGVHDNAELRALFWTCPRRSATP